MLGGGEGKTNHVGWDHPVFFGRNSKYLHDAAAIMKSEKDNDEDNIDPQVKVIVNTTSSGTKNWVYWLEELHPSRWGQYFQC